MNPWPQLVKASPSALVLLRDLIFSPSLSALKMTGLGFCIHLGHKNAKERVHELRATLGTGDLSLIPANPARG